VDNEILLSEAGEQINRDEQRLRVLHRARRPYPHPRELKERRDSGKLESSASSSRRTGMADRGRSRRASSSTRRSATTISWTAVITMVTQSTPRSSSTVPRGPGAGRFPPTGSSCRDRPRLGSEQEGLRKRWRNDPRRRSRRHFGNTPIEDILDIRGFNLSATLELDPDSRGQRARARRARQLLRVPLGQAVR